MSEDLERIRNLVTLHDELLRPLIQTALNEIVRGAGSMIPLGVGVTHDGRHILPAKPGADARDTLAYIRGRRGRTRAPLRGVGRPKPLYTSAGVNGASPECSADKLRSRVGARGIVCVPDSPGRRLRPLR